MNNQQHYLMNSYMILAPAIMTAEKDPKEAARKCLESVNLDPESYRIGHTKARILKIDTITEWR